MCFPPLDDAADRCDTPPYSDDDRPICAWCNAPLPLGETDYCDALCAAQAQEDSLD